MASLNQVSIELNVTGEREATQALRRYSDASNKLSNSVLTAAGKLQRVSNDWERANRLYREGTLNARGLQAAQVQLARQLAVLNGLTTTNGRINTQKALAELRAVQATKEAAAAAEKAALAEKRLQAERERLRAQFNPLYAASQRYETALNELNRAKQLGVLNSQQYDAALENLNAQLAMGMRGMGGLGSVAGSTAQRMNRAGVITQQTGYQVGDFIVQVQGGTNAFVAFGQQATQLAGMLTILGGKWILIGSVLGITIPLLTAIGAAVMRTRQAAREAANGVETLDDRLKSLDQTLRDYLRTREAARGEITVEELLGLQGLEGAEENLRRAREELNRTVNALSVPRGISIGEVFGEEVLQRVITRSAQYRQNLEALIVAENRVAILRQRQGELQFQNFSERMTQYQEEIALNREIVRFGEDSAEVQRLEQEQALVAELRRIEALRRANEITDAQAVALRRLAAEHSNAAAAANATADAARGIADEIGMAVTQANRLASALSAAASAGLSRQRQIAVLTAQISAARVGASTAAAGARAETAFDVGQTTTDPLIAAASGAIAAAEAAEVERLQNELSAITSTGTGGSSGGGGGGGAAEDAFASRIPAIREMQAAIEAARIEAQLFEQEVSLLDDALDNGLITQQQYNALLREAEGAYGQVSQAAYDYEAAMEQVSNTAKSAMEDAFMSIIDGSASASDAFKGMARAIIAEAMRMLVIRPLINGLFGMFGFSNGGAFSGGKVLPFANGGAFSGGNVIPFANGGVVSSPTMFPMRGNQTGLMGEAGPEAIMPLKRTRGGKLGVVAEGGGDSITVNQTINISTGVQQTVRNEIRQMMPQIAESAKSAVVDAKRRGGGYGRAFQ
jgi:hypothetical protein